MRFFYHQPFPQFVAFSGVGLKQNILPQLHADDRSSFPAVVV